METDNRIFEEVQTQDLDHDVVNHPAWYCDGGIETLLERFIRDGFLIGIRKRKRIQQPYPDG